MATDDAQPGDASMMPNATLDPTDVLAAIVGARFPDDLPASGAWFVGDHPGDRRFLEIGRGRPFALEFGGHLRDATVAYETWGELNEAADNAVLVCHALTGDSHASGESGPGHVVPGWWNEYIGPDLAIDTNKYFVVCANVLGGCQGTTGPASTDPATGRPYGTSFPVVSVRDTVRTQSDVADELGVDRWHSVIGGSMGGMQVLEWAVMFPQRVRSAIVLASTAAASAQQVGWSAVGRLALALDAKWRGGDYYDAADGDGPAAGLAVARQIAQITYRTDEVFAARFGRDTVDRLDDFGPWGRFQVEGYLDHHGQKLVRRFDANSYLTLNRLMDLHDIGRGRGGIDAALARVTAPSMVVSISSDLLYPPHQQAELAAGLTNQGLRCDYHLIDSPEGHDGFLLEAKAIGPTMAAFLAESFD